MDEDSLHHHAGGEQPLRATSWGLSDMRVMLRLCGDRFTVHGCRHGMKNIRTGNLLRKPWGWFSTHDGVKKALELRCNHGTDVKHDLHSGKYYLIHCKSIHYLLCRRFAKALLQDNVKHVFLCFWPRKLTCHLDRVTVSLFALRMNFILSGQFRIGSTWWTPGKNRLNPLQTLTLFPMIVMNRMRKTSPDLPKI